MYFSMVLGCSVSWGLRHLVLWCLCLSSLLKDSFIFREDFGRKDKIFLFPLSSVFIWLWYVWAFQNYCFMVLWPLIKKNLSYLFNFSNSHSTLKTCHHPELLSFKNLMSFISNFSSFISVMEPILFHPLTISCFAALLFSQSSSHL